MELTEQLIEAVKKHKILYDLSDPGYKNNRMKNKIWDEIGVALGLDGEEVKKRWKNLRDCYAKHLRSEKTHTGQQAKNINRYKAWPWAIHMSAFKPFFQFAPTTSNIESAETEMAFPNTQEETNPINADDANDETSDSLKETFRNDTAACSSANSTYNKTAKTLQSSKKYASKRKCTEETNNQSSVSQVLLYLKNKTENTSDITTFGDMELVFLGHAKTIKKFNTKRQVITKFRIAQIVMEEELNNLKDAEEASSPSANSCIAHSTTSLAQRYSVQDSSNDVPYSPVTSPPLHSDSSHSEAATWYEDFSRTIL